MAVIFFLLCFQAAELEYKNKIAVNKPRSIFNRKENDKNISQQAFVLINETQRKPWKKNYIS